jgi:hypothetical protein
VSLGRRPEQRPLTAALARGVGEGGWPLWLLQTEEGDPVLTEEGATIQPEPSNA